MQVCLNEKSDPGMQEDHPLGRNGHHKRFDGRHRDDAEFEVDLPFTIFDRLDSTRFLSVLPVLTFPPPPAVPSSAHQTRR